MGGRRARRLRKKICKDSDADGEPMANLNTKRLQYQIRGVGNMRDRK